MRSKESYIEITDTKERSCVVRLENPKTGKEIDLIGMVHIGTPGFYNEVQDISQACDAVIYEQVKSTQNKQPDRVKVSNFSDLYTRIAEKVSKFRIDTLRKLKPFLCEQYEDESKVEEIIDELSERFRMVYQGEAIDYDNAPENWKNADLNNEEFLRHASWGQRLILKLVDFKWLRKFISSQIAKIVNNEGLLKRLNKRAPSKSKVDRLREEKVYEAVSELTDDESINRIAIQYGLAHLPFIEEGLARIGYSRKRIDYIDFDDWIQFSSDSNPEELMAA